MDGLMAELSGLGVRWILVAQSTGELESGAALALSVTSSALARYKTQVWLPFKSLLITDPLWDRYVQMPSLLTGKKILNFDPV